MAHPNGTRVTTPYGPGTVVRADRHNGSDGKPRNLVRLDVRDFPELEADHTLGDRFCIPEGQAIPESWYIAYPKLKRPEATE